MKERKPDTFELLRKAGEALLKRENEKILSIHAIVDEDYTDSEEKESILFLLETMIDACEVIKVPEYEGKK